jgi:hypothetical protein
LGDREIAVSVLADTSLDGNGNDAHNYVRKIAGVNRVGDVMLKRGVIGDLRLFAWLKAAREGN